jgi:hypothetical protein
MEHHAGIDVPPERSSACVVDATGRILGPQALGAGGRQTPGPEAGQGGPGAQSRVRPAPHVGGRRRAPPRRGGRRRMIGRARRAASGRGRNVPPRRGPVAGTRNRRSGKSASGPEGGDRASLDRLVGSLPKRGAAVLAPATDGGVRPAARRSPGGSTPDGPLRKAVFRLPGERRSAILARISILPGPARPAAGGSPVHPGAAEPMVQPGAPPAPGPENPNSRSRRPSAGS